MADTRSWSAVDLLATIADGWSKARARQFLWERLRKPGGSPHPARARLTAPQHALRLVFRKIART